MTPTPQEAPKDCSEEVVHPVCDDVHLARPGESHPSRHSQVSTQRSVNTCPSCFHLASSPIGLRVEFTTQSGPLPRAAAAPIVASSNLDRQVCLARGRVDVGGLAADGADYRTTSLRSRSWFRGPPHWGPEVTATRSIEHSILRVPDRCDRGFHGTSDRPCDRPSHSTVTRRPTAADGVSTVRVWLPPELSLPTETPTTSQRLG